MSDNRPIPRIDQTATGVCYLCGLGFARVGSKLWTVKPLDEGGIDYLMPVGDKWPEKCFGPGRPDCLFNKERET